jgi:adenine phosphoribosyltransferase
MIETGVFLMISTPSTTIDIERIKSAVRDIPDFPKPGILFKDITTVLRDAVLFNQVIDYFYNQLNQQDLAYVVGIESRGFIFGAALAYKLGAGFVPIRKKGKLPGAVATETYELEYGQDIIEIHQDAMEAGAKVVLIDDLLATGGTAAAACKLLGQLGVNLVAVEFLIELSFLNGRAQLPDNTTVNAMICY